MSSTRKATGDGPVRQEKYASSPEFDRGLVAPLVAKRCTVLERAEDRELVWFLQLLSHQPGGLKQVVTELCERYPERFATPAMRRIGIKPGQIYNARQVQEARADIPNGQGFCDFPLNGECSGADMIFLSDAPRDSQSLPTCYKVERFALYCKGAAHEHLESHLGELCLNPALEIADSSPWYFPTLVSTLREYQTAWIEKRRVALVVTAIGQQVYDALDYASTSKRMVLIDGNARTGKTFAAKAWCDLNPGQARYVQVPSTSDELGFFRAIAKGLGMACGTSWKAVQLRTRIEEVLQTGQLTVVFDEAHYALPTSSCRTTVPNRINWMMTALVNQGVGIALVTTPQFIRTQKAVEKRTTWTSEQFTGRIGHYERLPETLSDADLEAVARALLPAGDERSIKALVLYAKSSAKYLAGIETAVARAQYVAARNNRGKVTFAEVKQAISGIIPSDSALADALAPVETRRRSRQVKASAPPLPPRFIAPETPVQTPGERNRIADLETAPG